MRILEAGIDPLLRRLPRGAALLGAVAVLTVVLGFVREAVIAYYFGASAELDAFLVALSVPRLIVAQVAVLATAVVLPRYVAHREHGRPELAAAVVHHWARFSLVAATVICLALAVFASPLIALIGPGLTEALRGDATGWLRALLPYVWMMIVAGVFKAVLDSHRRFAAPALSGALVSLAVIAACILASPIAGVGGLVYGFSAGAIIGFVWQWLAANRVEPNVVNLRRPRGADVHLPFSGTALMLVNSVALQLTTLIDRAYASSLPEGSIAALNYAGAVVGVPRTVITSTLATALFPLLASRVARGKLRQAFRTGCKWAFVVLALGAVPVALLIYFRMEIIALLFQRGQFDDQAARLTGSVMSLLPIMIIVNGMSMILARLLIALDKITLVAVAAVGGLLIKVVLNSVLVGPMGLQGLVLATVLSGSLMVVLRILCAWNASRVDFPDSSHGTTR